MSDAVTTTEEEEAPKFPLSMPWYWFRQWWEMMWKEGESALWCSIHHNRPGWCFELHHRPKPIKVVTITGIINDISIEEKMYEEATPE